MTNMRGTLLVNLAAILVMLVSVLVGGGYWLINKKEESMRIFERSEEISPKKIHKKTLTFEQAVKETKE